MNLIFTHHVIKENEDPRDLYIVKYLNEAFSEKLKALLMKRVIFQMHVTPFNALYHWK